MASHAPRQRLVLLSGLLLVILESGHSACLSVCVQSVDDDVYVL